MFVSVCVDFQLFAFVAVVQGSSVPLFCETKRYLLLKQVMASGLVQSAADHVIVYELPETSTPMPLQEAWKPRERKSGNKSPKWASMLFTHCQCNKFSSRVCTDGVQCQKLFQKLGAIDTTCGLDPGCKVNEALSFVEAAVRDCSEKTPGAEGIFLIVSDLTLPLCDTEDRTKFEEEALDDLRAKSMKVNRAHRNSN